MNGQIDQLVKSLLQKDSLEQCSLQELEQFANRHPYFGAAQLLLTKKLQVENSSQYNEQLQKTFLFFNNPLWVQKLLNETGTVEITLAEKKEEIQIVQEPIETTTPVDIAEENNAIEEKKETLPAENTEWSFGLGPDKTEITEQEFSPATAHEHSMAQQEEEEISIPGVKIEPIDPAKAELVFEPYHTVDYFASQGIKMKEEEKPVDKFGKQLRSFTDWLKTMKKLPVSELAAKIEPAAEQKVEQMAEHSLQERDVVTEAMAEVWEKQGNKAKAIDIYTKLSLLDPSKSVYFAAKIEDLKKLN